VSDSPEVFPEALVAPVRKKREREQSAHFRGERKQRRNRLPFAEAQPDSLAHRLTVPELVAVHEAESKNIREAFAIIARAEKRLNDAFTLGDRFGGLSVHNRYNSAINFEEPDDVLSILQRSIWGLLVKRLGLQQFLSISAAAKLEEQLRKGDLPPLTAENVLAMAEGFRQQIPDMLRASVREVFEWLTPQRRYDTYKTNSPFKVGRKVIMTRMVSVDSWSGWRVNYGGAEDRLSALENVFTSLDGKGCVTKTHYSALSTAIKAQPKAETCEGETPYFKFRGFKNGNLHVTFKRLDLLKRFNQIAGGKRLRPESEETP
jgi:hypothetical protein